MAATFSLYSYYSIQTIQKPSTCLLTESAQFVDECIYLLVVKVKYIGDLYILGQ